jgi:uncharacterized sporulation protein YeaH/YhbH (DUF444 family)
MKILPRVDRRKTPSNRHGVSRQKYLRREDRAIRAAVRSHIAENSIADVDTAKSKKIKIRQRNSSEPEFRLNQNSGVVNRIKAHNSDFVVGDRIERPKSGTGSGGAGSPDGEGEDDFYFTVSREEYLDYYFEDMALPDMVKKTLTSEEEHSLSRAGYASEGSPNRLDKKLTISRSSVRRRVVLNLRKRKLAELMAQRDELLKQISEVEAQGDSATALQKSLSELDIVIARRKKRVLSVSFIEKNDLKYRSYEQVPVPIARAVMFCVMDVSGSMSNWHKEMGKRFFSLLYLFLSRNYEKVDVVFIRHTTEAKEVDEEEFFTSRETGGTIVSSAIKLMSKIAKARYPVELWNLYGCYASDGDDWTDDLPHVYAELAEGIMPLVQHFAYVEISKDKKGEMWDVMQKVEGDFPHFNASRIRKAGDIYPVFRKLFKQKEGSS